MLKNIAFSNHVKWMEEFKNDDPIIVPSSMLVSFPYPDKGAATRSILANLNDGSLIMISHMVELQSRTRLVTPSRKMITTSEAIQIVASLTKSKDSYLLEYNKERAEWLQEIVKVIEKMYNLCLVD